MPTAIHTAEHYNIEGLGDEALERVSFSYNRKYLACVFYNVELGSFTLSISHLSSGIWKPLCKHNCVSPTTLSWSPCGVLAVGSQHGEVQVVFSTGGGCWKTNPLAYGRPGRPVRQLAFAPRSAGLKLLVAYNDGRAMSLVPNLKFWPDMWHVDRTVPVPGGLKILSVSWRKSIPGEPESFAIGTNLGLMVFWKSGLGGYKLGCQNFDKEIAVYAVAWAPTNGRSFDLLACCEGKTIGMWRLSKAGDGTLVLDKTADLNLKRPITCEVGCLKWDIGGMRLAVECKGSIVCVLRQRMDGQWEIFDKVMTTESSSLKTINEFQ